MEIININELKKVKDKENTFLEILLDAKNLMRIPVLIFYHKEQGFKNFLLTYDVERFPAPYSTIVPKIISQLTKLTVAHDLKIGFKGFPKEIFERSILRPGNRWKFEDKFILVGDSKIDPNYVNKFGENELKKLETNEEFYELYKNKFEEYDDLDFKKIGFEILNDFKNDKYYLRKRIVFVDSYPKTNEESSKERFVYYIYNRKDDFDDTIKLISNYFNKSFLEKIQDYLKESEQIVLSFAHMSNDKLRKTLYFTLHDFNEEEVEKIMKILNINEYNFNKIWGVGIDFIEDSISYKLYYEEDTINITEIKEYFSEFDLESKRKLLRFLNSRTKPLRCVLLDKKYKQGNLYSKRIDVSLQYNSVKIHQLMSLFNVDLRNMVDKELFTLSFEITNNSPEKINFYYALKIPDPEQDREEREVYRRNQY